MKKITITFFIVATLLSTGLKAQTTQMKMSEINPYFDAYLEPFAGAMAVGMGGGWTTTAKTHELFGFDVTFSGSLVNIPSSEYTFDAEALDMPGIEVRGNGQDPTISASNDLDAPRLGKEVGVDGLASGTFFFDGVKGLGINKGGSAALQVGFGLPKGTEIMVRFVPDISKGVNSALSGVGEIELSKTGMWGFGVKHDIKQWIPVVKSVPFLEMSAMFTYSSFKSGFAGDDLRFDPDRFGDDVSSSLPATTWDDQRFDFQMTSFTGALLVGANIPIFQPYIGLGFNSAKFEGGFKGNYPILDLSYEVGDTEPTVDVSAYEEDPLSVDFKGTAFNFQAGARLKLGLFVLHYTYSASKYSMHTAGLGFTFR